MDLIAYVVESRIKSSDGKREGTARVYVPTEARAKEIVSQLPDKRTYRAIPVKEIPDVKARQALEKVLRDNP